MRRTSLRKKRRSWTAPRNMWLLGGVIVVAVASVAAVVYGATQAGKRRISVWWDVGGSPTLLSLDRHLANLVALGVSGVVVMLTEPEGRINFSRQQLATFASALRARGIWLGVDTWSRPTTEFVASLPSLIDLCVSAGARFIEFDTEANWRTSVVRGYGGLDEAAKAVAGAMQRSPIPWGITTHPGRLSSTALTLGKHGAFVAVQAYSIVHTDEPRGSPPGAYQQQVYAKTKRAYGGAEVVMGLPAFDQEFPGAGPEAAMVVAAQASWKLVKEIRYWSWKWIGGATGVPRNKYAWNALLALRRA